MLLAQRVQPKTHDLTNVLIILFVLLAASLYSISQVRFQSLNSIFSNSSTALPTLTSSAPVSQEDLNVSIVQKAGPSVVTVAEMLPLPDLRESFDNPQNIGSGFIITPDGYIVTSKHVVADNHYSYKAITPDGLEYDVENIYRDPTDDIALLKINPNQHQAEILQPLPLGDSSQVKVGESVLAIGTALGQFTNTVTHGVVSGVGRGIEAGDAQLGSTEQLQNLIQTSAAINPGNSGGPLLNNEGQVIGVNTATSIGGQDIGFALPINAVKSFSKDLIQSI